jgi:hypothetical protein
LSQEQREHQQARKEHNRNLGTMLQSISQQFPQDKIECRPLNKGLAARECLAADTETEELIQPQRQTRCVLKQQKCTRTVKQDSCNRTDGDLCLTSFQGFPMQGERMLAGPCPCFLPSGMALYCSAYKATFGGYSMPDELLELPNILS